MLQVEATGIKLTNQPTNQSTYMETMSINFQEYWHCIQIQV
jgi:hypothetical protein